MSSRQFIKSGFCRRNDPIFQAIEVVETYDPQEIDNLQHFSL